MFYDYHTVTTTDLTPAQIQLEEISCTFEHSFKLRKCYVWLM